MAFEFKFPDIGEGLTEGEIVAWKVKVGDVVKPHQALLEVETDKAVVEIPAPEGGRILKLEGGPGKIIKVGEVIATIGSDEELKAVLTKSAEPKAVAAAAGPAQSSHPPRPYTVEGTSVGVVGSLEEAPETPEASAAAEPTAPTPAPVRRPHVEALPKDRQLARRLGVDIELIHGTGPRGRVTEADVRRAAERGAPERGAHAPESRAEPDEFGPVERVPLRGVRRRIAESMAASLAKTAQVTTMDEADVDELWRIREKMKDDVAAKGTHITLLAFVVKAVVGALKRVPEMNCSLDDARGETVFKAYYNVGVAVDTQDGLIVPNVKNADRKSVIDIARELEELSQKARRRVLDVKDLKGGTFTITNYGSIGGLFGTPVINYPEAGVLGVGRLTEKPVAEGGAIRLRKILPLSLTFDHRLVDGAHASHFLNDVIRHLREVGLLLVGL
jgi:pyruvate dehydrogenase E2 component (dihydrolipoamide acetyltransferase)